MYEHCPLPKTHRRLVEAHLLWHQTLDKYHDPDGFRANLNATIEALRNITFVLQNEKSAFTEFDKWYVPWQAQLKVDAAAKWLHEARTTVVHKGELESHSTAEVRLITWRDEVLAKLVVPVNTPAADIIEDPRLLESLGSHPSPADVKDAAVAVERRWSTGEVGNLEILEATAKVYGLLSDLVLDAHVHLNRCRCIPDTEDHPHFRSVHDRTGTLKCMATGSERRTEIFKLATRQRVIPTTDWDLLPYPEEAAKRYGFDREGAIPAWQELDPIALAEKIQYRAKRILSVDRYHQRMMFIRDGSGKWHMNALFAADRTEKHLLMRMAAQFVESAGCDAIIDVGESWSAPMSSMRGLDISSIQDAKGAGELLWVMVATREGVSRSYATPFTRGPFGGIRFGDTKRTDGKFPAYLEPILDVWRRQGYVERPDGKRVPRLWEPDPLDICFCGGPRRFAECCKRHIPLRSEFSELRIEIEKATAAGDFAQAEELSRAALAQYVIWVKQHTVLTMHVAHDLHSKIVNIDLAAIEELIASMRDRLDDGGRADLFVPQLHRLAEIIGVPRISARLVALASRHLSKTGHVEEAVLELDTLGQLDQIDDTMVLLTAAEILDLSAERRDGVLDRALSLATNDEERWSARFVLTRDLLGRGERDRALQLVDSTINELRNGSSGIAWHAEAMLLRWQITKNTTDLQRLIELINRRSRSSCNHYASILIDEGKYSEAEDLLRDHVDSVDPVPRLLLADARIRAGNPDSARELFNTIERKDLPRRLLHAYAVAAGLVALSCKDERIRQLAIQCLNELGLSGSVDPHGLLQALENQHYAIE